MLKEHAIIIDDNDEYRVEVRRELEEAGFAYECIHHTAFVEELDGCDFKASLIILDNLDVRNRNGKSKGNKPLSYWDELLPKLRSRHPEATFILVTRRRGQDLLDEVGTFRKEVRTIIDRDPFVTYLPKGEKAEKPDGSGAYDREADRAHYAGVRRVAEKLLDSLRRRRKLQGLLADIAFRAVYVLLNEPLGELRKSIGQIKREREDYRHIVGKDDSWFMDVIAEHTANGALLPIGHEDNVVICTEEQGLHNKMYNRIINPDFFVFSDPFDGSKAFKSFTDSFDAAQQELSLKDILENPDFVRRWVEGFKGPGHNEFHGRGPVTLNAPWVSLVLAERHRVVGTVLVNVFTSDVYLSVDTGNYYKNCGSIFEAPDDSALVDELSQIGKMVTDNEAAEGWLSRGWERLRFREWDEYPDESEKLFLCQLGTHARRDERKRDWVNVHAETCLRPILPEDYDWRRSFEHRYRQGDFTPGPARILFLTDSEMRDRYDAEALGGNSYRCVMSAGEPLTEWIGWFSFLRHTEGVKAFCLREKLDPGRSRMFGPCVHKRRENDPSPMTPEELNSIFRDGYVDLGVLQTTYADNMSQYKDTLAIVLKGDPSWTRALVREDGDSAFVRVSLPVCGTAD